MIGDFDVRNMNSMTIGGMERSIMNRGMGKGMMMFMMPGRNDGMMNKVEKGNRMIFDKCRNYWQWWHDAVFNNGYNGTWNGRGHGEKMEQMVMKL